MDQNSIEFIQKLFDKGKNKEEIKQSFLDYGWDENDIDKMIEEAFFQKKDILSQGGGEFFKSQNNFLFEKTSLVYLREWLVNVFYSSLNLFLAIGVKECLLFLQGH